MGGKNSTTHIPVSDCIGRGWLWSSCSPWVPEGGRKQVTDTGTQRLLAAIMTAKETLEAGKMRLQFF